MFRERLEEANDFKAMVEEQFDIDVMLQDMAQEQNEN